MRTNKQIKSHYNTLYTHFPKYGGKLAYCQSVWRKTISILKGEFKVINLGYHCKNDDFDNHAV